MINHSTMQKEYIRNAKHRWNIKSGAVRSGKSYVDVSYMIIKRIRERKGLPGLNVIIGVSKTTIERNVLQPMREIYTEALVGTINSQNIAIIAGEPVYCIGAEKESQVAKIQGSSIKYCYGDEIAKWNHAVFHMLESRLDKEYSCFDGACNPESPTHWLKEFIDREDLDIYLQEYTLFDNPFLPKIYVDNLCKEYANTIFYDRLILGKWVKSEGAIYRAWCDAVAATGTKNPYILQEVPNMIKINVGLDWGGNGSWTTFTATGFTPGYKMMIPLETKKIKGDTPLNDIENEFENFITMLSKKYSSKLPPGGAVFNVYCDSAEQIGTRALMVSATQRHLPCKLKYALKISVKDRINLTVRAFGLQMIGIPVWNTEIMESFSQAVYNDKEGHQDERLDDSTSNKFGVIDKLDSFEYSFEYEYKNILNVLERGGMRNGL